MDDESEFQLCPHELIGICPECGMPAGIVRNKISLNPRVEVVIWLCPKCNTKFVTRETSKKAGIRIISKLA